MKKKVTRIDILDFNYVDEGIMNPEEMSDSVNLLDTNNIFYLFEYIILPVDSIHTNIPTHISKCQLLVKVDIKHISLSDEMIISKVMERYILNKQCLSDNIKPLYTPYYLGIMSNIHHKEIIYYQYSSITSSVDDRYNICALVKQEDKNLPEKHRIAYKPNKLIHLDAITYDMLSNHLPSLFI